MKIASIVFVSLTLATLTAPLARASGEECSAAQKTQGENLLKAFEDAERQGKIRDAFAGATGARMSSCMSNGYKRRDAVIERTGRKLGAEAEKAGRFGEAFDYFRAPFQHGRIDYDLADADRALLKHVKANPGDHKIVFEAAQWFDRRGNQPSLKATRAVAKASGEKLLAAEDKAFASSRASLGELTQARDWLNIAGEAKRANARAEQRGDALLAHGAFSSVERAFQYYDFAENKRKLKSAEARARKLGDEHAKNGQVRVAAQFYELAGDSAKAAALEKKSEAHSEKGEAKRQEQFKKDQQSLEKALGL